MSVEFKRHAIRLVCEVTRNIAKVKFTGHPYIYIYVQHLRFLDIHKVMFTGFPYTFCTFSR